jgi:Zn-dependent protease with chaperone function
VTELLKGPGLGLVFFLGVNALASLLVRGLAPRWVEAKEAGAAARRARVLFVLRLFPAGAAIALLLILFVPAYLAHEPRDSDEAVGAPLLALATLSVAVLCSAATRGFRAGRDTWRLERSWAKEARPVCRATGRLPALSIAHPFPVVTVVGLLRPRLYVAEQVLRALSDEELTVVVDHELAHVRARDNLRHLLLRGCPDLLAWTPFGGRLAGAWLAAAEEAADDRAARGGSPRGLVLAEALLKVARLVPRERPALMPALALHNGDDLARRVERLLQPSPPAAEAARGRTAWLLAGLLLMTTLPFYAPALRVVHALTERLLVLLT